MSADDATPSSAEPALLAGVPGIAGATLATCGAACAGACGPPLLGLLGLSSSGAALLSWAGWLRPVFFAASVVSLAVAFHRAYRRQPRSGRFVQSRLFVWIMAVVTLALFATPVAARLLPSPSHPCAQPCSKTDCPPRTRARPEP